jgi:Ca2+-binding EF-hand superfamily protein
MDSLPEDVIEDCQDVYALLGVEEGLHIKELGKALRMVNLNPSEQDIKNLTESLDLGARDLIDFEEFIKVYKNCKEKSVINVEEVKSQINKLDKHEDGNINTQDLKNLLMTGEEPLTLDEANEILSDFDSNGKVVIKDFLDALLSNK